MIRKEACIPHFRGVSEQKGVFEKAKVDERTQYVTAEPKSMFCIRFWLRRLSITTIRASSSSTASQMEAPTSMSTVSAASRKFHHLILLSYS